MKPITLTIADITRLNLLQKRLAENKPISTADKEYLSDILAQIPTAEALLIDKIPLDEVVSVNVWDTNRLAANTERWRKLFALTPGWDYTSFCYLVTQDNVTMLRKNVIAIAQFAPSMAHNLDVTKDSFETWLKDDGTAVFWLPTMEDVQQYPELYNFKGSWKEAYLLLIETLKKGWPMEEFPEELKPFIKSK